MEDAAQDMIMLGAVCEELVSTIRLDGDTLAECEGDKMQEEASNFTMSMEVSWIQSMKHVWQSELDTPKGRCTVVSQL